MTSTDARIRGPRSILRQNRDGPRRGFSLVEVLLAGVLLAVFGAVLTAAVGQSAQARDRAESDRQAAQALEEVLTRLDLIGPRRLETEGPVSGELPLGGGVWAWELSLTQRPSSDLFDVIATVRAGGGAGPPRVAHTRLLDPVGWRDAAYRWEDLE